MRLCVQYALTYPSRVCSPVKELDFYELCKLSFAKPDTEVFPLLALAYRAIDDGGAMPAVVNAANEVAVKAHLDGRVEFYRIAELVCECYERMSHAKKYTSLEDIISSDREARRTVECLIRRHSERR